MGKRGKSIANIFSKSGRKPGLDATPDPIELEAGSPVAEPAETQIPSGNGWHAEDKPTPETTVDIEEARLRLESDDFEAKINITLKKAQESLQHRLEAQTLRDRSQSVFAQSESIMEEAIRSVEAAGKAYSEGFAADTAANMEAVVKAQELAETLRSRLKENQSAYQDALGQALGTKEIATRDLAAALDSLNFEVMNVEREWEESARASSMADSAKETAIQELLAVHTIWNGLASQQGEPLAGPDSAAEDDGQTAVSEAESLVESIAGGGALDPEQAGVQTSSNLPVSVARPASETLYPGLTGLVEAADDVGDDLRSRNNSESSNHDEPLASQPMHNTLVRPVAAGAGVARTYTGRVYLMFDASLTREGLESVWDAVEEAAGSGVIVDTRLVSQDTGVQVTLDLDNSTLDVAAFRRRLSGAEITPLAEDRLKVAWPAAV